MSEKELDRIKDNVYMKCEASVHFGRGLGDREKEELALIREVDRLNNIINDLEKWLKISVSPEVRDFILDKLKELKEKQLWELK